MERPSRLVGAVLAGSLLVLGACGSNDPEPAPTRVTTEPSPTETTEAPPTSSAELELAPGSIGPLTVGMSQDEAAATGLVDVDVRDDGCDGIRPLVWKPAYTGVDLQIDATPAISSLGVTSTDGPRTRQGFGVGSTFGELLEVYGGDLSAPEKAGYDQVGVFVRDDDAWLGYLFGEADSVDALTDDPGLKVTFAEVTRGEKPSLIRDGC